MTMTVLESATGEFDLELREPVAGVGLSAAAGWLRGYRRALIVIDCAAILAALMCSELLLRGVDTANAGSVKVIEPPGPFVIAITVGIWLALLWIRGAYDGV